MKESIVDNILSIAKVVIDNTPLLITIITIGGAIKLFTYYKLFNILVFPFMDVGEIITLFASNLVPFIAILSLLIITILIYYSLNSTWLIIVPVIFILGVLVLNVFNSNIHFYETVIQTVTFLILYAVVMCLLKGMETGAIDSTLSGTIILFALSILIISGGTMFAVNEAYKVKSKKFYAGVEVYVDGDKLNNNVNNYYIGKTNSYLFFYHETDNSTDVIPMSKVDRIVFK